MPVAWDELDMLKGGDHWTIRTAQTRLKKGNEPWKTYATAAKKLQPAMKTLRYKPD